MRAAIALPRRAVVLVCAALSAAAFVPSAGAAAPACRHLISDPRGDVDSLGSPPLVDDQSLVDLVYVDLKTDKRNVTASFAVVDIDPETTTSPLRHSFVVYFGSQGKRYALQASREVDGDIYTAWVVTAGQDYSDSPGGYAWAMSGLGAVTGSFDGARNVVRVVAPLELFAATGGLKGLLSEVHAMSWTGAGAAGAAAEGSDDMTDRVRGYRMGATSCAG
ncbi:MAG: hypothetical protein QOE99_1524 [Actinomycetota bacterium]|jgi:hypothetical protein|nr:hypothetical protein [Actinomycetota bacterium]MDX6225752.1 hypothetical protein [Frankiales bacterium]MDX6274183.1 hypothetical protein [Frankiales bacterium]